MKKLVLLVAAVLLVSLASGFSLTKNDGKAALISLSGNIKPSASSGFSPSGITPEQVRDLNDQAVEQGADAVIYEINSGGGAVVASKEVYRDIEDMSVPTVCRFRDVSASGAYLASLGCDSVVADSATITGSIGVKSSYLQYPGLMEELGVEYVSISNGSLKEVGNPYQNISKEDRMVLHGMVDEIKNDFISKVEEERNLSNSSLEEVASSKPFLGDEAKRLGLVGKLGGRETAIREAEGLADKNLTTFKVRSQPEFSFLSLLSADFPSNLLSRSSFFQAEIG